MKKSYLPICKEILLAAIFLIITISGYYCALKYPYFKETTAHGLSETTKTLLEQFNEGISMTLYTQNIDTYHQVKMLIDRYQQHQKNIHFQWRKETLKSPDADHQMLILNWDKYEQRLPLDHLTFDENQLTSALFKLHRKPNQWVVFLQGHNEPDPFGRKNSDFNLFRIALENQGLKIQRLNIANTPFIPDNTHVLIIASPKSALLPKEQALIEEYITEGKDLLWLIDPFSAPLPSLSEALGVSSYPGTIVDVHGQALGTPHPAITIIEQYPHLPFQAPNTLCAFPWATALMQKKVSLFKSQPLLYSNEATWIETKAPKEEIVFDPKNQETAGPLLVGVALTRSISEKSENEQRIIIIGNSRFLSNGAIQNYGNLAFGLNAVNWLNHDDTLCQITQPVVLDTLLHIHLPLAILIQYGFPTFSLLMLIFSIFFYYRRFKFNAL